MSANIPSSITTAVSADAATVRIVVSKRNRAVVDSPRPLPLPRLLPLLECRRWVFEPGGTTGIQQRQEVVRAYRVDEHGRLSFSAGFLPRVRQALEELGYQVRVEHELDSRNNPRLTLDDAFLGRCDHEQEARLRRLAEVRLAQIEIRSDAEVPEMCLLLLCPTPWPVSSWRTPRARRPGPCGNCCGCISTVLSCWPWAVSAKGNLGAW